MSLQEGTAPTGDRTNPLDRYMVPVVKAKGESLEIWTSDLPDVVYREVIAQGLKVVLNRGMTKVTKTAYPVAEELKAAALEAAEKNFEAMKAGKIRIMGAKGEKVAGVVMTEARRIAKNMVKDELKRQNIKLSTVDAKDITEAANSFIAADPSIIEMAKENIAARDKRAEAGASALASIVSAVKPNPKKQAKIEEERQKGKEVLSALQAGKAKVKLGVPQHTTNR